MAKVTAKLVGIPPSLWERRRQSYAISRLTHFWLFSQCIRPKKNDLAGHLVNSLTTFIRRSTRKRGETQWKQYIVQVDTLMSAGRYYARARLHTTQWFYLNNHFDFSPSFPNSRQPKLWDALARMPLRGPALHVVCRAIHTQREKEGGTYRGPHKQSSVRSECSVAARRWSRTGQSFTVVVPLNI